MYLVPLQGCVLRGRVETPTGKGLYQTPLLLWLQERMEAEDLMRQGDMEQEPSHTDVKEHMRADHSGGASPEPPMPKGRARSTSRRRTSGSESGQQPQKLRARDEF